MLRMPPVHEHAASLVATISGTGFLGYKLALEAVAELTK